VLLGAASSARAAMRPATGAARVSNRERVRPTSHFYFFYTFSHMPAYAMQFDN